VGDEELKLITEVIKSGNMGYIYGTKIREFQSMWSELFGMSTSVAVSSGTAALHTALIFLDIGPGDEVIVPAITDMGTVIAVLLQNAVPVFADVELRSQNMDPGDFERRITSRTKAVIPVHLYGFPCNMDPIIEIARKHELFIVEDCCQAHLTKYKGKLVGTFGDVSCFSFQQSKHMTTGDGGMVMTNHDELCGRKLVHCADKGWPRELYRDHLFLAPNYHMTELQAAVGIAQLRKIRKMVGARRKSAGVLSALIQDLPGVFPPQDADWAENTHYEYALGIDPDRFTVDNTKLAEALSAEGLKTAPSYLPKPIYMYDVVYKKRTYGTFPCPYECSRNGETAPVMEYTEGMCPTAVEACRSMLFIPWNEKMTEKNARDVAGAIRKVLSYYAKDD
jgi:dTDP-4-amino-4,6-dideoxygalactose transaminase